MPPLHSRRDDILALAYYFLRRASEADKLPALSTEAVQIFMEYSWPGNVRELSHAVKQAVALAEGETILPGHLPAHLRQSKNTGLEIKISQGKESTLPPPSMVEYEKAAIIAAMKYCQGSIPEAAAVLGIGQATLYRKINRFNIITG
jgi:DNA-binding NtrC family response regulator